MVKRNGDLYVKVKRASWAPPRTPALGSRPDHAQRGHSGPRQGSAATPREASQERGDEHESPFLC